MQAYNQRTGRHVRCYVPTHSLVNYSQWMIVCSLTAFALVAVRLITRRRQHSAAAS